MKCYTTQSKDVYDSLMKNGIHVADKSLSLIYNEWGGEYQRAYNWVANKMKSFINDEPEDIPIFLWPGDKAEPEEVDDNDDERIDRLQNSVNIFLDIPDNLLFATDFNLYHFIINNWCCDCDNDTKDQYEIKKSWDKAIASISDKNIQLTTWRLRKEWVTRVEPVSIDIVNYYPEEDSDELDEEFIGDVGKYIIRVNSNEDFVQGLISGIVYTLGATSIKIGEKSNSIAERWSEIEAFMTYDMVERLKELVKLLGVYKLYIYEEKKDGSRCLNLKNVVS